MSFMQERFFLIQWAKTFWHALLGSLTNLNYYVEVLNTRFKFSLKFVAAFYLLLGIILTGIFTFKDLVEFSLIIDQTRDELLERYPNNLTFDWNGSELYSSSSEKIQVPFPAAIDPVESAPQYLAEINTATDTAPENVSAVIYLNKNKMYINSFQGTWSDSPLVDLIGKTPQHIDRMSIQNLAENSKKTQQEVLEILPWLALPFFTIGMFLLRLLVIAFNSIIVQFLFQITNKPLTYKKVFQLSMHALVPVELIHQISYLTDPHLPIPMFNISYWFIMSLLLWHLRYLKILQFEIKREKNKKKD